jgi:hypothetical protein
MIARAERVCLIRVTTEHHKPEDTAFKNHPTLVYLTRTQTRN